MAPARIAKAWRAAFHRLVPARLDQSAVGALAARSSKGRGTSEEEPELAGVCRGRGYGGLVHRGQKAEIVVVLAVGGKPRRRDLRKRGTLAFVDTETGSRDLVRQDTVLERLDGSNEHGIRSPTAGGSVSAIAVATGSNGGRSAGTRRLGSLPPLSQIRRERARCTRAM